MQSDHACAVQTHFFHFTLDSQIIPENLQKAIPNPPKIIIKVVPNASKNRSKTGLRQTTPQKTLFVCLVVFFGLQLLPNGPPWAPAGYKMPSKIDEKLHSGPGGALEGFAFFLRVLEHPTKNTQISHWISHPVQIQW